MPLSSPLFLTFSSTQTQTRLHFLFSKSSTFPFQRKLVANQPINTNPSLIFFPPLPKPTLYMLFSCPFIRLREKKPSCLGVSCCLEGPTGSVQYLGLAQGSQRPDEGACQWASLGVSFGVGHGYRLAVKDVAASKPGGRDVLIWR